MDYLALVNDNQREDSYVNATKWCGAFGKRLNHFLSNKLTQDYIKAVENKTGIPASTLVATSKRKPTYVHPMVALALAEWLSPEFHVYVNQTFQRYLENDITLADEILQKATKEQAKWLAERAQGKIARAQFTDELKRRKCNEIGFARNTNAVYEELFGSNANDLKSELQTTKPRDQMTQVELAAVRLTELLAIEHMEVDNAIGNKQTERSTRKAGKRVARVFE